MTGYQAALQGGAEIIVKIDGDGQMDPAMVPRFVAPIAGGKADYTKGNRFVELADSSAMPAVRIVGNTLLSFLSKLSSGYWFLFDPTNGFTAIHSAVARALPAAKLSKSFFFESDMLFRLGLLGAVVYDIPMAARYGDDESRLRVLSVIPEFIVKHVRNALKRVFYQYFLWDFGIASVELVLGLLLFGFGLIFGIQKWVQSASMGVVTPAGTVMLAALPVLLGVQMLLGFLGFDMARRPQAPLWIRLVSSLDGGARVGSDRLRAATGPPRDR
jgi:glycosyltransferase involved in cell wall biosynthesis